jgi:hypothetical protein
VASPRCIGTGRLQQRGAALLLLLAVLVLGASWYMVSRTSALSAGIFTPSNRDHNALVLSQAKQALIGYVAMTAAQSGENNPGRFPCPEGAALVGTSAEGIAAPYVGPPSAPSCATVGRLPWRTLGLDKLVDASSEPLWYVVSPGWQLVTSATTLTINSNSIGQLNVDGQANAAVALIIAPGAAMNVLASAGCTARSEARSAPSPTIDARDYIECFNSATSTFATTGTTSSFNDQVVRITVADVMPAIEAAIASRVEREIVPLLRGVYATNSWGANVSAANPVYPFAAPFADPSLTASYQGNAASCAGGVCKGLLPVTFSNAPGTSTPCTPSAGSPCAPGFVRWVSPPAPVFTRTSGATLAFATCSALAASVDCTITADVPLLGGGTSMNFMLAATVNNVGMAMRKFDTTVPMTGIDPAGRGVSALMNPDGSAQVTLSGSIPIGGGNLISNLLCFLLSLSCYQMNISMPIALLADHPVLNSADPVTGWFMRNEWYRVLYYAAAQTTTPTALPTAPACTPGTNCVTVSNLTPANNKRAILILTGRSINGSARPSATLADYLEFGNAAGSFERQPVSTAVDAAVKKPFNDRIVVVDSN